MEIQRALQLKELVSASRVIRRVLSSSVHCLQLENAAAGALGGFATIDAMHSLGVFRTRFQVNDGRVDNLPAYKNTAHAILTIARSERWPNTDGTSRVYG
ncbi:hypothetical protein HS088_TW14G00126 [Tripterygium wilfordii]|uniref:Uncharacterized protein n=1 Tax=Tripterygium wilfordii TaxID=458696 RepID=A0A7J7CPH3_TRIWF|nr:hypothetical protein HS088_TW14G00126 [Tripterygium wilfordii]